MMASFTVYFFSIFGFFSSLLLMINIKTELSFFFPPLDTFHDHFALAPGCFWSSAVPITNSRKLMLVAAQWELQPHCWTSFHVPFRVSFLSRLSSLVSLSLSLSCCCYWTDAIHERRPTWFRPFSAPNALNVCCAFFQEIKSTTRGKLAAAAAAVAGGRLCHLSESRES